MATGANGMATEYDVYQFGQSVGSVGIAPHPGDRLCTKSRFYNGNLVGPAVKLKGTYDDSQCIRYDDLSSDLGLYITGSIVQGSDLKVTYTFNGVTVTDEPLGLMVYHKVAEFWTTGSKIINIKSITYHQNNVGTLYNEKITGPSGSPWMFKRNYTLTPDDLDLANKTVITISVTPASITPDPGPGLKPIA